MYSSCNFGCISSVGIVTFDLPCTALISCSKTGESLKLHRAAVLADCRKALMTIGTGWAISLLFSTNEWAGQGS